MQGVNAERAARLIGRILLWGDWPRKSAAYLAAHFKTISGGNGEEDPPVPIPNTEVKLFSAESTWLVTAREDRTLPDSIEPLPMGGGSFYGQYCT